MPLLDLKTDLKSLKYGQDQPGGGSSNQPYIKVDINKVDSGFNQFRLTKFDDGLIRGGVIGTANAAIVDTLRIGKFFVDFPKGPLFLAKQVGLQLSNPKLQHIDTLPTNKKGANLPISGQGFLRNANNFFANIGPNIEAFISNVANKIENAVGPTRIYNLGINTLTQVPLNAVGGHIMRHGFLPTNDESKLYLSVVKTNNFQNNNNRLEGYANQFFLGGFSSGSRFEISPELTSYIGGPSSVYGIGNTVIKKSFDSITNNWDNINRSLGFSRTYAGLSRITTFLPIIKETFDYGLSNKNFSYYAPGNSLDLSSSINPNYPIGGYSNIASQSDKQNPFKYPTEVNYYNVLGLSKEYFSGSQELSTYNDIDENNPTQKPSNLDLSTYSKIISKATSLVLSGNTNKIDQVATPVIVQSNTPVANSSYDKYRQIIESRTLTENRYTLKGNPVNQFGIYGNNGFQGNGIVGSLNQDEVIPDATTNPIYSNGREVISIKLPWNKVSREVRIGSGRQDEINLTPIFSADRYNGSDKVTISGKPHNIRDLVKFRIQAVNTDSPNSGEWMIFRAYLTDLSDNTDATWNPVKYAGRGESLYIYDSFSRKISVSFKVAALSEAESRYIYQKLNFLMSNTMPDYNSNNLMRGPLTRLTVGNWVDSQLGILNSVQLKVPQDSPWEIAIDEPEGGAQLLILPHIVEVTLSFTPIGSESKGANRLAEKSTTTSHIAQNNTGRDASTLQYIR